MRCKDGKAKRTCESYFSQKQKGKQLNLLQISKNSKISKKPHGKNLHAHQVRKVETLAGLGKGQMVREFEEAVWSTPLKTVSPPVKTQFGYHLIWVHEREE